MEIKELARGNGRLLYFGSDSEKLDDLEKITRDAVASLNIFFRAKNMKLITDNVDSVEGRCVKHTPLDEIPMGKKVKFIAGDPMGFEGTAIGVVKIGRYKFLEIEITPGELYFYSYVDYSSRCNLLKLTS